MAENPFTLPNAVIKLGDGSVYQPPEWFIREVLPKLMELPKDEYLNLRMWLAPAHFFFDACEASQNPLMVKLFQAYVMEDKYAYLARYTPPPGVRKQ